MSTNANLPSSTPPIPPTPSTPGASGKAIAALILGIAAFVCCGFFTAIPALILGRSEEKAIQEGRSPQAGLTLAKVGWILGLVNIILNVISIIFIVIYIVVLGGLSQMQHRPGF